MNDQLSTWYRHLNSKHPNKPKGCNGWWNEREQALLHGSDRCPIHDPKEEV